MRSLISALLIPCNSNGNATLSYTVREDKRLKCWKIIPIFLRALRKADLLSVVKSVPFTITEPDVGASSILMQRIKVDLPAPDWPIMPKISPSFTFRLISFNASTRVAPS